MQVYRYALALISPYSGPIFDLRVSPNKKYVISAADLSKVVRIHNLANGEIVYNIQETGKEKVAEIF